MKLFIILFTFIKSLFSVSSPILASPFPLKLDLQFFAEGDEDDDDDGDDDDDKGGKGDKPFAQFKTKEELNKRLARAQMSGKKALAKELGFDSIEAMQASFKKDDKTPPKVDDKDTPPDVDKLIEDKLKEERAKGFKRILNSEVKLVANELGFADYEDALALADLSEVKENDKGDLEGVQEALKALAEKKPHLLKKKGNIGSEINNQRKNDKDHLENIKKLAQSRGTHTTQVNDPWAKR